MEYLKKDASGMMLFNRETHSLCRDCRTEIRLLVMIPDETWQTIAPEDGHLCLGCIEPRLRKHGLQTTAGLHYMSEVLAINTQEVWQHAMRTEINSRADRAMKENLERQATELTKLRLWERDSWKVREELNSKSKQLTEALALNEQLQKGSP